MMVEKKYTQLINEIFDLVGGEDNVSLFIHCVTRLRFNIKDRGLVNQERIDTIEGVVGTQWSGEQLQVIIGPNVSDVYKAINKKNNLVQESKDELQIQSTKKAKFNFNMILDYISGSISQILPALIGCGMIKVLILILDMFNILSTSSGTYQLLTFAGDSGLYFLPILAGKSAAKKLGANESLGMVMGALMVYPGFLSAVSEGVSLNFFGLPVFPASYTSTIFPVLLAVAVMAPIQRFFGKYSFNSTRSITEPLFTILIMIPIVYCVVGPIGSFLGIYLSNIVLWLYNTTGFFGVALLGDIMPFLIMTGMHAAFTPYTLNMMGTLGYEPIFFTSIVISNINQGVACLAVSMKTKKSNIKSIAFSSSLTAILGGVTEPGMYGINLKYKTPMIGAVIGSFIGAGIAGIFKVYVWAVSGSAGLFAIPSFISKDKMNVIWLIISIIIGSIVTFIITFILYKDEKE